MATIFLLIIALGDLLEWKLKFLMISLETQNALMIQNLFYGSAVANL